MAFETLLNALDNDFIRYFFIFVKLVCLDLSDDELRLALPRFLEV